jgi:hypothetical protein
MNRLDIISMARDAEGDQVQPGLWAMTIEDLERFAKLVARQKVEDEPVAWMYDWTTSEGEFIQDWTTSEAETLRDTEPTIITNVRPLYTTPPQRTWVWLTNEEHMQLAEEWGCLSADWVFYAAAVERKIKERNT